MFRKSRNGKTSKLVSTEDPLGGLKKNLAANLTWIDFLLTFVIAAAIASLLISYRYQPLPPLKVGEVAKNEIRATQDITIEDKAVTQSEKHEAMRKVPAVFDYDPNVLASLERDIRSTFTNARELIQSAQEGLTQGASKKLTPKQERELVSTLKSTLSNLYPDDLISVFYAQGFSKRLEDQLVAILKSAMLPGLVSSREQVQRHQESGIKLRDMASGQERLVSNMSSIKDIAQARSAIRQSRFELSELDTTSRKEIVRFLESLIAPTVLFDTSETEKRKREAADNVGLILRQIKQGKVIVQKGDRITEETLLKLNALRGFQERKQVWLKFLGGLLLSMTFLYFIWHYFVYHQLRGKEIRNCFLLISLVLFVSLLTMRLFIVVADIVNEKIGFQTFKDPANVYYALPFTFGAILITLLADVNAAVLFSLLFALLVGLFTMNVNLVCYVLIGSFVAIYGIKQYKERLILLKVGLVMGGVNLLALVGLDLFARAGLNVDRIGIWTLYGLHSGVVSAMFASLLLPVLETLFKITTDIKLLELSNLNTPVLRRMSVEAPGTYHHSIVMGTLAEAAAEAIGANPLLVRVAAYYHDIGKLKLPEYFVENQIFSQNKHDKLAPSMSSLIISSHVKDGLEMAKSVGLMPQISDMIPQHHGTRLMTYFYERAKAAAKGEEINEADFRYPGPKPQSKEAAIMMIADSVEATSRTLVDPTPAQVQGVIRRIIDTIVADGQFTECDITIKDLKLIEQSMLHVLTGILHHRIEYPGYDFSKKKQEVATANQGHQ